MRKNLLLPLKGDRTSISRLAFEIQIRIA